MRTRLGDDVLVKLKTEELFERDYLSVPTRDGRHAPDTIVAATSMRSEVESHACRGGRTASLS